nr:hypothetical protein [Nonlabens ulvanivorans]
MKKLLILLFLFAVSTSIAQDVDLQELDTYISKTVKDWGNSWCERRYSQRW